MKSALLEKKETKYGNDNTYNNNNNNNNNTTINTNESCHKVRNLKNKSINFMIERTMTSTRYNSKKQFQYIIGLKNNPRANYK
jgi:hypothetical protein